MNDGSTQHTRSCEAVRGLTVDRIIARLRATKAEGARVVNLRCAAAMNVGCDDVAILAAAGADRENGFRSD